MEIGRGGGRMIAFLALNAVAAYSRLDRKPPVTAGLIAANTLVYIRPYFLHHIIPHIGEVYFNPYLIIKIRLLSITFSVVNCFSFRFLLKFISIDLCANFGFWDSGELLVRKLVSIDVNSASKEKTQAHIRELEEEVKLLKNLSHLNIVAKILRNRKRGGIVKYIVGICSRWINIIISGKIWVLP